jgi:hypothetical protein
MKNSMVSLFRLVVRIGLLAACAGAAGGSPRLRIQTEPGQRLVVQWPATVPGYVLEQSSSLGANARWLPVTEPPFRMGDQSMVRLEPTATARFFRLAPAAPEPPPVTAFFLPGDGPTRNLEVEYDGQDRMHFVYVRHTLTPDEQEVVYGSCEPGLDCDRVENWRTAVVHSGAIGTVQLEVTGDGRPRLAIQDQFQVTGVRVAYLACEAQCLDASRWRGIALAENVAFGGAFLQHTDQRWFDLDPHGNPRLLISNSEGAFFLACNENCTEPTGDWTNTPLDTTGDPFLTRQLFYPVLKIGADGTPHILGQTSRELVYLTCVGDYRQLGDWRRLILSDPNHTGVQDEIPVALSFVDNLDLELARSGDVVIAFGGFVPGGNELRTYLFRCQAGCDSAQSWSGRPFRDTLPGSLDLALDPKDHPHFLLAGQIPDTGERIVQWARSETGEDYHIDARWSARVVASSSQLEAERPVKRAPETPALCSIATSSWEFPANRLLFLRDGSARLVANAAASSICQPGMDEWIDRWGTVKRGRTIDLWVIEARARWAVVR